MLTKKEAIVKSIEIWKELYETGADEKPDISYEYHNFCPLCEYVSQKRGYLCCDECLIKWPYVEGYSKKINPDNFCCDSYYGLWADEKLVHKRKFYAKKILYLLEDKLKEMERVNIEVTDLNVINNMIFNERGQEEGNYIKILREIRDNFGDLVISGDDNICRLVGFHDDGDDYYYIMKNFHRKISYQSCAIRFIPIKGRIPTTDYEYLNNSFIYTEKCIREE